MRASIIPSDGIDTKLIDLTHENRKELETHFPALEFEFENNTGFIFVRIRPEAENIAVRLKHSKLDRGTGFNLRAGTYYQVCPVSETYSNSPLSAL